MCDDLKYCKNDGYNVGRRCMYKEKCKDSTSEQRFNDPEYFGCIPNQTCSYCGDFGEEKGGSNWPTCKWKWNSQELNCFRHDDGEYKSLEECKFHNNKCSRDLFLKCGHLKNNCSPNGLVQLENCIFGSDYYNNPKIQSENCTNVSSDIINQFRNEICPNQQWGNCDCSQIINPNTGDCIYRTGDTSIYYSADECLYKTNPSSCSNKRCKWQKDPAIINKIKTRLPLGYNCLNMGSGLKCVEDNTGSSKFPSYYKDHDGTIIHNPEKSLEECRQSCEI